ncbi:MAG: hypothetical protein JST68_27240 [Bacteroidetes bacterium]|nr:hypothetical protein [Bacteroidota bacterium]
MRCILLAFLLSCQVSETKQVHSTNCLLKRNNAMEGSVKDKFALFSIPATDPLYNPTVQVIVEIQNAFLVYPVFFFYDDKDHNNAMATDEVVQANGPDGTVIFGRRFFNREFIKTIGGTTIPVIMAHEYAHIVDYKFGVLENAGVKRAELFADYFAGLYMYLRVLKNETTDIAKCYESFRSMGDTDFGKPSTHGTPEERYKALNSGFKTAQAYAARGILMNLDMAINEGKKYVMENVKTTDNSKDPL